MHSQLYLTGQLAADPELLQTKKGKLIVKLLLETEFIRQTTQGDFQPETVILPVNFFSREAEVVKDCRKGDFLVVGCHLYGTQFKVSDGIVKHGVQIIADHILQAPAIQKEAPR